MKKLCLCGAIIILLGCTEQKKTENVQQQVSVSEPVHLTAEQIEFTEDEAFVFAHDLFVIIENDEKLLKEAFEKKDYDYIAKYNHMDMIEYARDVYLNQLQVKGIHEYPYFPNSENLAPYLVCDTAFNSLYKYAVTMNFYIRDHTETLKQIMLKQRDEFESDKSKCERRVNMSYEQAYADYEK